MDFDRDVDTVIELGGNVESQQNPLGMKLYKNSLSSREMESLVALSDAFLPSIDHADISANESVAMFFLSSASMAGTPERVGGLICERLKHPKKWMIRMVLWLLSSWIGTFILCGLPSISTKFPYFQKFPNLSQKVREKILLSWSLSFFYLLRMLFKTLKLLILFVYFSQVDEKNENLTWKAIGYPGQAPEIKNQKPAKTFKLSQNGESKDKEQDHNEYIDKEELFGPLYEGLVNMNLPLDMVGNSLRLAGFPVRSDASNSYLPSLVIKCDAVVIGSGSGGGVVAGVLAKAGHKVVVLEKGQYFARTNLSLLEGPTMDQMYHSAGLLATDDLGVIILAGSTIGGGSTVNWSASIRTPQHVINEWSERCDLELFDSPMYKEAMEVVCEKMGVQSEINDEGFNNAVLRKGCEEMVYPVSTIPRNSSADHYCGWCCFGCSDGRKKGTAETWLVDLVNSGNGVIFPGCEATKVLHKSRKNRKFATGVAFCFQSCRGEKQYCVVESKVIIAACGALSTPALLKASGLTNANIGKNLHLHPVTMAWGYFPDEPNSLNIWPEQEKKSYKGGIMTAMSTVVASFEKSGYGALIQTPSLHPGMFASVTPWISGSDIKTRMSKFSRTAHIFALARDKGSGTVNSPNNISYRMEDIDDENLQKGLDKMLRILAAAGAEEIGTHHNSGRKLNVKKASYREFNRFVKEESSVSLRDLSSQIFSAHQMGSCRMGVDPKDSVVNEMGETWEVEGLFVADSSVFPTALGVNPMVTVQATAYCIAQSILSVLRRKKLS